MGLFILEGRVVGWWEDRLKTRYVPSIGTRDFGCGDGDDHRPLITWSLLEEAPRIHLATASVAASGNLSTRDPIPKHTPATTPTDDNITCCHQQVVVHKTCPSPSRYPSPVTRHHPKTDECIFLFSLKYRGLLFSAAKVRTFCRVRCNFY